MSEPASPHLLPQESAGNPMKLQELLAREAVAVAPHFQPQPWDGGDAPLDTARYTSREFHRREADKLWPKAWQLACREEQVPEAGDCQVYDIAGRSVLVVRGGDGQLRAFYNSCLHRGRALRHGPGRSAELRCPFHGFAWSLEGEFRSMPCAWDFKHLAPESLALPQLRCDSWGGFVFVNFDAAAAPLRQYLGVLPEHFAPYGLERSCTLVHIQKRIPCNWKAAQEAFFESMHTRATHPHILTFIADVDSQYDAFGDNVSRMITPSGVASSHLGGVLEEKVLQDNMASSGRMAGAGAGAIELPEGVDTRRYIGELNRTRFSQASGRDLSAATISELQDAILYSLFPNLQIWAGYFVNIVYRFIPDGDRHDSCLFDFRMLGRYPEGQKRPPAPAPQFLDTEDSFVDKAAGIGPLAVVFDQDMRNLQHMTRGLNSSRDGRLQLAHYQELRIRHHHRTLDRYLDA
jgi:phenylpropionate dioxygenase-like ring-hydroxylating dioxygenase large terminal subunit